MAAKEGKEVIYMKIAIPTEDKTTISEHLGGAPYFMVVTVENKKIGEKETREKPSHKDYASKETHPQLDEKGKHGFGPLASDRHKEIYDVINDCEVLIAGRMGFGAYDDIRSYGMKVIVSDVEDIEEAVSNYIEGKLLHKEDRIC